MKSPVPLVDPLQLDFVPADVHRLDSVVDAIRSRIVDCDGVAASLGLDAGRPRQRRRWRCPSVECAAKTEPTLSTPSRGGWFCHRCGAKGDAFALVGLAQGFYLPLRGPDFRDVVAWLAPHAGVTLPASSKPSRPSPLVCPIVASSSPETDPVTTAVVGAAWNALYSRQSDDSAAARWLDGRGIPARLVRSGFAILDRATASDLADAPAARWLDFNAGLAVVAPLRSMRTGEVAALQARVFVVSDPIYKRCAVGKVRDDDGAPRVFGDVARLATARTVVLVEGMADTWAAEALTDGIDEVVVIGASNAGALPDVAKMLKGVRVVVVRHLDAPDVVEVDKQGAGQRTAREALVALESRGFAFNWPGFRRSLLSLNVDTRPLPPGFDLAAALEMAHAKAVNIDNLRSAFLSAIGEAPSTFRLATVQAVSVQAPTTTAALPVDDFTVVVDDTIENLWGQA